MEIEKNAPLTGKKEILINAPVDTVWKLLIDINSWPEWQEGISEASLEKELKKGAKFSWKAMGMKINSEIVEFEPMELVGWKGESIGMNAVHVWTLKKKGNNTLVTTEESLSGWLSKLLSIFSKDFMDESLKKSLNSLKKRAEK